ncbi:MAG: amidohydrolase [Sulfobacillus benefaciens]|uniref:Amidohydrolase n=1 Tax=Sulfobacillus benefaciens TaxID=453960 RepID=A0A2T2XHJ9_9FIRM|nr:MAG: amidohydrolase [Sulfobacillus benefaciens]
MHRYTIANVNIIDGSNQEQYPGFVTIVDDRIESVSPTAPILTGHVMDAEGLVLTPGFIDMHSHSDLTLFADGRAVSKISQGITTEIIGQCGISGAPLFGHMQAEIEKFFNRHNMSRPYQNMAEYLEALNGKISVNVLALIGHGTLRRGIMGEGDAPASDSEMQAMQLAIDEAMRAGALGLSTGLIYPPGCYTTTDEVVALTKAIAPYQGLYFSHLRNEGDTLIEAVQEALEIGRRAQVGVQLSHHKAMGPHNWGKTMTTLDIVGKAVESGQDVYLDQYPYLASATTLSALLPDWALAGGPEKTLQRLKDPEILSKIRDDTEKKESRFGWHRTHIGTVADNGDKRIQGLSIADIASQQGILPFDALVQILLENRMQVSMIRFGMGEDDVKRVFLYPRTLIGTDGGAVAPDGPLSHGNPHPRTYGTFPRVLAEFVRDKQWVGFEEAIYRMTGLAAKRLRLRQRGLIKEGYVADMVLLDPDTIQDRATFAEPHQTSRGIHAVYVNGRLAWKNNKHTGDFSGRPLKYFQERGFQQSTLVK